MDAPRPTLKSATAGRRSFARVVSDRGTLGRSFIRDNHEGYISLEAYERNQRVIADNSTKLIPTGRRGAVRSGAALLAGLLRCGHCGRKLTVTYSGNAGNVLRYICKSGVINHNEDKWHLVQRRSSGRSGWWRDRGAFSNRSAWMRRFAPSKRMPMPSWRRFGSMEIALERAQYEARRAGRQYDAVDPGEPAGGG